MCMPTRGGHLSPRAARTGLPYEPGPEVTPVTRQLRRGGVVLGRSGRPQSPRPRGHALGPRPARSGDPGPVQNEEHAELLSTLANWSKRKTFPVVRVDPARSLTVRSYTVVSTQLSLQGVHMLGLHRSAHALSGRCRPVPGPSSTAWAPAKRRRRCSAAAADSSSLEPQPQGSAPADQGARCARPMHLTHTHALHRAMQTLNPEPCTSCSAPCTPGETPAVYHTQAPASTYEHPAVTRTS